VIGWRPFELRWRDELCRAAVPHVDGSDLPSWHDLDAEEVWRRFDEMAPPRLLRGWRLTVWLATLRLRLRLRPPRHLDGLTAAERDAELASFIDHRSFVIRQLASVLLFVTCFGYLGDADVRSRTTERVSP
jgi:hypothetical protein